MATTGSFQQAAFEASVVSPDGRPLDFRSVIELIGAGRVGVDPADPRARLTETGSLLSARGELAYVRSPPFKVPPFQVPPFQFPPFQFPPFQLTAGLGSDFVGCWARREVAALARRLPIEGRVRPVGPASFSRLPGPTMHGRARGPGPASMGPGLLPYRDLAAGWIRPGWRADVIVIAPGLVVIGIDDGASCYLAAPLLAVRRVVEMLHRADVEQLLASARPVPVLARHWSLDGPTRSRRLGARRGFLGRSLL